MPNFKMDIPCVFCSKPVENYAFVALRPKGVLSINNISQLRRDSIQVNVGQKVHTNCRKNYIRTKVQDFQKMDSNDVQTSTTSNFSNNICIFCGKPAELTECRRRGIEVHQVESENFEVNILNCIREREDKWAFEVEERIRDVTLWSAGAKYHQNCSIKFRTSMQCNQADSNKKTGRPQNQDRDAAFLKICKYMMEHEGEVFALSELVNQMQKECDEGTFAYSIKYLKQKLLEYFGDNIVICQKSGTNTLVLFRYSVSDIISDFNKQQICIDSETEKTRIIQSAARLIRSEILSLPSNKDKYPLPEDFNLDQQKSWVPKLLSQLLSDIIKLQNRDLKISFIGQAIVQVTRPRAIIAPLQIGLGVQMHHNFVSKFLIQTLNKLGACSPYAEVQKFELCAVLSIKEVDNQNQTNKIVKFVGDNLDHDTRTLDGKGTFHGMGIIAAFTPSNIKKNVVKRIKASIEDVREMGTIEILPYEGNKTENKLLYEELCDRTITDDGELTDTFITWFNRTPRPSWSGIMQSISLGLHSGKSEIVILPMIDLNPSDFTCINSTLHYVANLAKTYNVTPILTFDQPLYWKAQIIIQNQPEGSPLIPIILLLGGFHTQMSFMGCIGHLIEETGLQEALETVYAANSVTHMMTGKAFSRALRGHHMIDNALNALLTQEIVPDVLNIEKWDETLMEVAELYDQLITGIDPIELNSNEILSSVKEKIDEVKKVLSDRFRTARLWLQNMSMVQILRSDYRSERTGNWKLHLQSIGKMLPYFVAAGHNHYAKCAYIYLQQMLQLEDKHPDVYKT